MEKNLPSSMSEPSVNALLVPSHGEQIFEDATRLFLENFSSWGLFFSSYIPTTATFSQCGIEFQKQSNITIVCGSEIFFLKLLIKYLNHLIKK